MTEFRRTSTLTAIRYSEPSGKTYGDRDGDGDGDGDRDRDRDRDKHGDRK